MRIVDVETIPVPPRLLFVKVSTDEGIIGWGEPIVEGLADVTAAAVSAMAEYLVGQDPSPIERHWQHLRRSTFYRGGPVLSSALSGLDQALWDIKGKALGLPVHSLLGGPTRECIRMYGSIHGTGPEEVADHAREVAEDGYTAVKVGPPGRLEYLETLAGVRRFVARVEAVREAVGDGIDIAIDLHGRSSLPLSLILLSELEPLRPLFVEEPVRPEFVAEYRRLVEATSIPIAGGERCFSRWDIAALIDAGVAVLQPDASHAGGISEVRRIAAQAEVRDASLAPHSPLGPVALAACLAVGAAIPNLLIQEQSMGVHDSANIPFLTDPSVLAMVDGHISVPAGPGLGIEIDEQALRAASTSEQWRTPTMSYDDGSYAEW